MCWSLRFQRLRFHGLDGMHILPWLIDGVYELRLGNMEFGPQHWFVSEWVGPFLHGDLLCVGLRYNEDVSRRVFLRFFCHDNSITLFDCDILPNGRAEFSGC